MYFFKREIESTNEHGRWPASALHATRRACQNHLANDATFVRSPSGWKGSRDKVGHFRVKIFPIATPFFYHRKGVISPIQVVMKVRQGRKACTLITGFEPFLVIDAQEMADDLRKICAGSTSGKYRKQ